MNYIKMLNGKGFIVFEKINQMIADKQKSVLSSLFSALIVLGTFSMLIVSYFALTK